MNCFNLFFFAFTCEIPLSRKLKKSFLLENDYIRRLFINIFKFIKVMKKVTKSVANTYFKRWTNQAYAVFSSLGKEVKIGVLLVAYILSCPSEGVLAQTTPTQPQEKNKEVLVDEVVVSAQRSIATYADITRVVSVITKREIEQAGVQSINELLEFALSVDVRQRGQHGIQADITMRGGSFDQVLVLLNGVNISDPQTGHLTLNLPISLDAIERVEVIAGSTSRIYGPNAFSGAINLITGSYRSNIAIAKLEFGEHGLFNSNVTATIQGKKSRHLLSLGYKKSNGYISNSDYKTGNGFYQGQWTTDKVKYDVQLGRSIRKFGANTFYSPKFPNQYEETTTDFVSAKATFKGDIKFTPTVYYRRQTDHFELFRDNKNAASWYKTHNNHLTNTYGVNLNASKTWSWGRTAIGGEFRSENILSNVLGKSRAKKKVSGRDNAFYDKEDSRENISLFLEHSADFIHDRLTVTAGVMMNYNNTFDDKITWFPGVDVGFKLIDNLKLYGTANKALRMPTFTDLYYNGPTKKGNVNLVPEKATSYEGGLKFSTKGIRTHVSYFFREGKNLIDWTKINTTDKKWIARNITDVNFYGVETALQLRPFLLSDQFHFIRSLNLNFSYTKIGDIESEHISAYVLDNLKYKFDGEITFNCLKHLFLSTRVTWQDRAGTFGYYASPKAKPVEKNYAPFWLVNSRLSWQKERYEFFFQVANIFNKKYYDIGNVIQPGRWISGGLKMNLQW